jgi:enterochelin esterase family protein
LNHENILNFLLEEASAGGLELKAMNTSVLPHLAVLSYRNFDLGTLLVDSEALKQNPLGDPALRRCPVMSPKGAAPADGWPVVLMLSGFTGNGPSFFNVKAFEESSSLKLDAAAERGDAPLAIYVFVDAMTFWGGSQFIDSDGMGRYETFVVEDVCAAVASAFSVSRSHERWCVMGGSSGGYGALRLVSAHPSKFGVAIALAPDSFFEASLLSEIRTALPVLKRMGGVRAVREELASGKLMKRKDWHLLMNVVAMGLCYAPLVGGEPVWPIDAETGVVVPNIWAEWLKWDPLEFLRHRDVKAAEAFYLDAGDRDQFQLQYGTRQVRDLLKTMGANVHYVGFEGTHFDLSERRLPAWAWLAGLWRG